MLLSLLLLHRACSLATTTSGPPRAPPADLDVILYGATGCVGHLAAAWLANQTGLRWAIADRNKTRLQELASSLEGPSSKPEMIISELTASATQQWVPRARAVATAAGPFSIHSGEVLVRACAEAGVHYVDTSDEFYWQREMVDAHAEAAEATGAKIVLSGGFCALAGDLGAEMALARLGGGAMRAGGAALDAWLETYNGGVSAGVVHTPRNASYPKEWDTDPYVLAPHAPPALKVDTLVEGMKYPRVELGEGLIVPNLFGPYDARLLRRAFVQRGQVVKLRVGARADMYSSWGEFLLEHPLSWASIGKCPTRTLLRQGAWAYRFRARAAAADDDDAHSVLLSGPGDPGYHFTAAGLAEVALCLANVTAGCLTSGGGGVLLPSTALDARVLAARLQRIGLLRVQTAVAEAAPRGTSASRTATATAAAAAAAAATDVDGARALLRQLRGDAAAGADRRAVGALLAAYGEREGLRSSAVESP